MNFANKSRSATLAEFRTALLQYMKPERVQHMLPNELVAVQSKLGYGDRYGFWVTPREWLPAGTRRPSMLQVDFRERLTHFCIPDQHIDDAILYCTRYAVLLALVPSGVSRRTKNKLQKPHSIQSIIYRTIPLLIAVSAVRAKGNGHYVYALGDEDLRNFSSSRMTDVRIEMARIHMFCDLGLWSDRPAVQVEQKQEGFTPEVAGADIRPTHEAKRNKYKSFSDDWVAEAGWRALWLVQDLGPNLLSLGRQIANIVQEHPHLDAGVSMDAVRQKRRRRALQKMAEHRWVDRYGRDIVEPPFPLTVRVGANTAALTPGQWPPTHVTHILKLVELLQSAHLFVALLAMGSRISEMLSLRPGAITRSSSGTPFANGMTFKLTQVFEGQERDWPLPDVVVKAVGQQEVLRKVLSDIGFFVEDKDSGGSRVTDSLWVTYGNIDEFNTTNVNWHLRTLVKSIGMRPAPDGQNLSTHRFRKTIARLVALAVAGAPKVLMDLFGHKSIEMTLYYILTDPVIAAESKQIADELVIMRSITAIENIDKYGGRVAKLIKHMVEQERFRLGKDLGAEDIRELAEILTMNGQAWELSRPGVICTKLPGSPSPCAKKVGHPEPSRCMADCDNRLEEAFLREDVNGAIAESIGHYEIERDAGNGLMQDFWAGQVLTNLNRFDDLRDKWTAHLSVKEIFSLKGQPA